MLKRIATSGFV